MPVVFVLIVILNLRYVVIEKKKLKKIPYAVTDKRILIVMEGKEKKIIEKDINRVTLIFCLYSKIIMLRYILKPRNWIPICRIGIQFQWVIRINLVY